MMEGSIGQGAALRDHVSGGLYVCGEGCAMRVSALHMAILCLAVLAGDTLASLVSNGNFESGAGGFSTEYVYSYDLTASGTVVVGVDPCDHHPLAASYGDHTSGVGRMLIANGSTSGSAAVWEQTVSVAPNTEYAFYYWLSAWTPCTTQQTQIRCLIDGVRTGPAGFTSPEAGDWTVTLFRWKSGSVSQANIRLVDRTGTVENNDFALDDIGMIATGGDYVLMTSSTLGGSVESPGEGAFLYPPGETVALEAKCEPGYEFAGWSGEFSDPGARIWTQMDTDRVATAVFQKLDYPVTIRASGAMPNEFFPCDDSADRLGVLCGAMESETSNGLILGERKGLCEATYRFPIFRPPAGTKGFSRIVVNVYGTTISSGSTVWIAGSGPHRPIAGNVHVSFGPSGVTSLLEDSQEPVYWLPVRINAAMGGWDLAAVYVSYECPGIPANLLRRFHDHFSVYRALECYAGNSSIRDLYALRVSDEPLWEAVVQATAFAEDSADVEGALKNAVGTGIEGFHDSLDCWKASPAREDLAALAACNSETILICLDNAVSSGRSHICAYAEALGDGSLSQEEARELNEGLAGWKADLVALDAAMQNAFGCLCVIHGDVAILRNDQRCSAAETMIRAMSPWLAGRLDEAGSWTLAGPTYLEQFIQSLQESDAR
jgi:hypothetical protein